MFSAFKKFGKLGALASSVARAWSPLALWPDGVDTPGMWISPRDLTSEWADYLGTTPVVEPGTVADSSNPVGLALDIRAGATVLTDPGLHMLQSTSAARPLASARVNLLRGTETLENSAGWEHIPSIGMDSVNTFVLDPDGGNTGVRVKEYTNTGWHIIYSSNLGIPAPGGEYYVTFFAKGYGRSLRVNPRGDGSYAAFDLVNGLAKNNASQITGAVISAEANGWWKCGFFMNRPYSIDGLQFNLLSDYAAVVVSYAGDGASGIALWHPQFEIGSTSTPYQSVSGDSTYDATGVTPFQRYDGTDDGMATASFAEGTLINGMDCLIAVRRDSAANAVCGLYESVAEANKVFGIAESGSGSGCVGSGAGTPTVWVDNTQLTGGTAVTRGTLHTALTAGSYHILEFRNLDLSAWTATGFGLYTSYVFPGARGDIMLFESTASTADKDAARQYLADYYGVTLP